LNLFFLVQCIKLFTDQLYLSLWIIRNTKFLESSKKFVFIFNWVAVFDNGYKGIEESKCYDWCNCCKYCLESLSDTTDARNGFQKLIVLPSSKIGNVIDIQFKFENSFTIVVLLVLNWTFNIYILKYNFIDLSVHEWSWEWQKCSVNDSYLFIRLETNWN